METTNLPEVRPLCAHMEERDHLLDEKLGLWDSSHAPGLGHEQVPEHVMRVREMLKLPDGVVDPRTSPVVEKGSSSVPLAPVERIDVSKALNFCNRDIEAWRMILDVRVVGRRL